MKLGMYGPLWGETTGHSNAKLWGVFVVCFDTPLPIQLIRWPEKLDAFTFMWRHPYDSVCVVTWRVGWGWGWSWGRYSETLLFCVTEWCHISFKASCHRKRCCFLKSLFKLATRKHRTSYLLVLFNENQPTGKIQILLWKQYWCKTI